MHLVLGFTLLVIAIVSEAAALPEGQPCSGTIVVNTTNPVRFIDEANCDPAAEPKRGQIIIPQTEGICQLRVDFLGFGVGRADFDGNCVDDKFTITGAANLKPNLQLCGTARDHVYLHYGLSDIAIETRLAECGSEMDISITSIPCEAADAAPYGCTQYFTCPEGEVRSFNFPNQQLNNQRYTVCVGAAGKSVSWSGCIGKSPLTTTRTTGAGPATFPEPGSSYEYNFFISGISPYGTTQGDACRTDYISIPPGDKICGSLFPNQTQSSVTPAVLYVSFDEQEIPDPSSLPIDPTTGCPVGFLCEVMLCGAGDTCSAPSWYFTGGLTDVGNVGFCLHYSIV